MNNKELVREMIIKCRLLDLPKITLVMPTHRTSPENKKDKILFKNLLHNIKNDLENHYPKSTYETTLEKLNRILDDTMFWMHQSLGLVVLASGHFIETLHLQYQPSAQTLVSSNFYIQPIFKETEILEKNYLVDLAKDRFKIYRINQYQMMEMSDMDIKTSFSELYDDFDSDSNVNVGSYGGLSGMYHGHRDKSSETKKDREKYFRYLDKEFRKLHVQDQSQFIFSGTKENISMFKQIAQVNYYHDSAIDKPLSSIKNNELEEKIKEILTPLLKDKINTIEKEMVKSINNQSLLVDFIEIQKASLEGRVKKAIIKANHLPSNKLNAVINQIIEHNGEVILMSEDQMKMSNDIIAIINS